MKVAIVISLISWQCFDVDWQTFDSAINMPWYLRVSRFGHTRCQSQKIIRIKTKLLFSQLEKMANAHKIMFRWINLAAQVFIKLLSIHFERPTDMRNRSMLVTETSQVFSEIRVRHTGRLQINSLFKWKYRFNNYKLKDIILIQSDISRTPWLLTSFEMLGYHQGTPKISMAHKLQSVSSSQSSGFKNSNKDALRST